MRRLISVLALAACTRASPAPTPAPAANGTVRIDAFSSRALGAEKRIALYLPPSYATSPERRYPVVYYLHGLAGTETDWLSRGGIDHVADSLIARGMPEVIIAMPDGDDGWYSDWAEPVSYDACVTSPRAESASRYCVAHQRYDSYVADDVVRYVDSHYRTLAERAHRGIAGLSMGGYGAIKLALEHPSLWSAAASHSGVLSVLYVGGHPLTGAPHYASTVDEARPAAGTFWARYLHFWGHDLATWRANDPTTLAAALVERDRSQMPALFFDDGRDDPFVDQNRAFDWELTRLGVPHRYAEWPGAHTWMYWSAHVAESLSWMAGRIR